MVPSGPFPFPLGLSISFVAPHPSHATNILTKSYICSMWARNSLMFHQSLGTSFTPAFYLSLQPESIYFKNGSRIYVVYSSSWSRGLYFPLLMLSTSSLFLFTMREIHPPTPSLVEPSSSVPYCGLPFLILT
jgi:hypothetical protein